MFLFYESTTGMVPIMGPIQTLCTRALTELATPLTYAQFCGFLLSPFTADPVKALRYAILV